MDDDYITLVIPVDVATLNYYTRHETVEGRISMITQVKNALEYAIKQTGDPVKIKEEFESYFHVLGWDRRYKFRWCSLSGNAKHTRSGIFKYRGRKYYFYNGSNGIEIEYA